MPLRRLPLFFSSLLLLCALAPPVGARPKDSRQHKLHALYESGHVHYSLGEYEASLADYRAALLLERNAAGLFNIAQCYRQLGRATDAARTYRSYLEEAPDAHNRAQVEGYIAEMDKLAETQQRAKAEAAARAEAEAKAEVKAEAKAEAKARAAHPEKTTAQAISDNAGPAGEAPHPWYKDGAGWALVAVGVASAGAGVGLTVSALSVQSQSDAADQLGDHVSLAERAQGLRIGGYVAFGAGAAFLVAGVIKFAIRPAPTRTASTGISLHIGPGPGLAGAALGGTF